jgi:hypothetical protein
MTVMVKEQSMWHILHGTHGLCNRELTKAGSFIQTISMWWLWVPKLARATPPRAASAALGCFLLQLVVPLHQIACCWQAHSHTAVISQ